MTTVRPSAVEDFKQRFHGDVIMSDDVRYDAARRVWNGMIDRHPAVIVRPTTAQDVARAIRFARDNDLVIAIRGGGHSLPGLSTCDDGLVLDLSAMRGVTVDAGGRSARANGGALLSELDAATQGVGMVCPVGVVGHTGVGGLTLGGGMGRLQRRFGLTIDNLLAVQLVTADGHLVRASEDENAELFWGMRGAGANFGVVTAFEYRLHPMQPAVTRGTLIYPASMALEAWSAYRSLSVTAPDELHLAFNIRWANDDDDLPDPVSGGPIVSIGFLHSGDARSVDQDLALLRELGPAALETQAVESYLDIQTSSDVAQSWGHRYYSKGSFVNDLPAETLERIVEHVSDGAGIGAVGMWAQGGAMGRVAEDAMAYTGRAALFDISAESQWDEAAQDDERIAWTRGALAIVEPHAATGRYVNEQSDTGDQVIASIYGADKLERLVALKRAWDPENVFRLNQNIKP